MPLALRLIFSRMASNTPRSSSLISISLVRAGGGRPGRLSRRQRRPAPSSRSPSITLSTMPASAALGAFSGRPDTIRSSATFDPGQPRQALGAAGTGREAQIDFRLADLRAGHDHPVVTGHRRFQATAQGVTVDRGNHRLGAGFKGRDDVGELLFAVGPGQGEVADIGAGNEPAPRADQHDRLDVILGIGLWPRPRRCPWAHRGSWR